jgi:hypothetical protein
MAMALNLVLIGLAITLDAARPVNPLTQVAISHVPHGERIWPSHDFRSLVTGQARNCVWGRGWLRRWGAGLVW